MKAEEREFLQIARRDIGNILVHWTREQVRSESRDPLATTRTPAFEVLKAILSKGALDGGLGYIRGSYRCVCFTESPVTDIVSLFSLSKLGTEGRLPPKYEPYGISISKEWLFDKGGRPVIYQSESEYDQTAESMKWRHCRYEPNRGVDFTWEREWRIRTDLLVLDPEKTLVIVPTRKHVQELSECAFNKPTLKWVSVPLTLLGLKGEWL